MSAKLEGFQPMVPAADERILRIEHVYTGRSTVEPLPYLVDAQRRSDRREGRDTWVLVGSETEEAFLVKQLRSILGSRAQEKGNNDNDESRWGVRCTEDIEHLSPDDDCVVVTTTENALIHLMAAEGATPRQFSDKMTFMFDMGWGNLTTKAAYAYDRLVRFAFDNGKSTSHFICTISSDKASPFNRDWVARQQDCKVIMGDEMPRSITFWEDTEEPLLAMDEIIEGLQRGKNGRAIMLMDCSQALKLETIGRDLKKQCHVLSLSDGPKKTWEMLSDTSKHIITNGAELTYLGDVQDVTDVILYPMRQGTSWDEEINQVVFELSEVQRPRAELEYAMSWRGRGKAPELHYLGPQELYGCLEEEPIDSMVYTSHFDNHVLSCLSVWPEHPVINLPLKVGRNPNLIEQRLRRLMYKGLLEVDKARGPRPSPVGLLRSYGFLKLTLVGRIVSELVNPCGTAMDSAHAACLVGQLFVKMQRMSTAVIDAVCSLAVVLTSKSSVTYIDSVIQPKESFKEYWDNPESLASEHCHRGAIWLAVCVWHFTITDDNWKAATDPKFRRTDMMRESTQANLRTLVLWYRDTFEWEIVADKVKHVFDACGVELKYGDVEHRLSSEELLEVEDMLVTAFMDKLAFVYVPARDGAFGRSITTRQELLRPTDEQMRLINLEKCWEQDKAVVGQETPGIYCIFTHCRMQNVDGRTVAIPYDLTYVSRAAVQRALDRVDAPVIAGNLFSKIETYHSLDM